MNQSSNLSELNDRVAITARKRLRRKLWIPIHEGNFFIERTIFKLIDIQYTGSWRNWKKRNGSHMKRAPTYEQWKIVLIKLIHSGYFDITMNRKDSYNISVKSGITLFDLYNK